MLLWAMINIFQYGYASWTNVTQIALSCEGTRLEVQAINDSKEILMVHVLHVYLYSGQKSAHLCFTENTIFFYK